MNSFVFTLFLGLLTATSLAQTVYFQQDFQAGGMPGTYVNASPNANQFTGISGLSAAIVNNTLQFDRSAATGTAHFSRAANFSPVPKSLYVQLDFEVVSTTATAANSALVFYVGSNFGNSTNNPVVADTYARFGISLFNNGGEFAVRHIESVYANSINSPTFTGKQTITFVLNNSGTTLTYLQPGGGFQNIPDDTYDLWVGNTQVFNDKPVVSPAQTISDFKLRVDSGLGAGVVQFDNMVMRDITGQLPVSVTYLKARPAGSVVVLEWGVHAGQVAARLMVERSTNALDFTTLGVVEVTASGTYTFTDTAPEPGWAYYRLVEPTDGVPIAISKVVAVETPGNVAELTVLGNPATRNALVCRAGQLPEATFRLTSPTGETVPLTQQQTPGGLVLLQLQGPVSPGVYVLSATAGAIRLSRQVLMN